MSVWVLDTDTSTLLLRGHTGVREHVADKSSDQLALTIITVEELLSGWYTRIRRANTDEALERAYFALQQAVEFTSRVNLLAFDKPSISRFHQLRTLHRRMGTNDLRIAAIALENNATLVTRNTSDFGLIHGLRTENWAD
jgi:tRNA(fMet)-specific endonuclease VapC